MRRRSNASSLSLQSPAYYWARAGFERVRLQTNRRKGFQVSPGVRILAYHRVTDERDFLGVQPSRFRRQLEIALECGYRPVSLVAAVRMLSGNNAIAEPLLCVTFDDGYQDNLNHALPHLEDLGVPATILLPTAIITGTATYEWYVSPPPSLSWAEAEAVLAGGLVDFHPHGLTHRPLNTLTDAELHDEIDSSRREIELRLGYEPTVFCFPAGRRGPREVAMVKKLGFAASLTTDPGINTVGDDLFQLKRTAISWSDSVESFRLKMGGMLDSLSPLEQLIRHRRSRPPR